jgi:hypothetical membrane protein
LTAITRTTRPPAGGQPARAALTWHEPLSGVLLMVAGSAILLGIVTAEALYPAPYSTHRNTVSDLAAMRPQNLIRQPSAAIFNTTMIVTGLILIVAAYCLHRAVRRWLVAVPATLMGAGILGVGIFPGTQMTAHQWLAMLAFTAGSVTVLLSSVVLRGPLRYLSAVLGAVAMASLVVAVFFMDWAPAARLGEGGVERLIAYPVVLWMVSFGAWLASGGPRSGAQVSDDRPRDH